MKEGTELGKEQSIGEGKEETHGAEDDRENGKKRRDASEK